MLQELDTKHVLLFLSLKDLEKMREQNKPVSGILESKQMLFIYL